MKMYLGLNSDELRQLPYAIIGETASCAVWETGRRKRLFAERFTEQERDRCYAIIAQAKKWLLKTGVPEEIKMRATTLALWYRLAAFCGEL